MTYRHFSEDRKSPGNSPPRQSAPSAQPNTAPDEKPGAELEHFRREMETRLVQAREQGHAEGKSEGERAAQIQLAPVLQSFQSIVSELNSQKQRVRDAAEEDVVKLSIAIAQRVLRRELTTDPEAILGLVKAAMAKLNAREMRRLRLSPSDAAVVETNRANIDLPSSLEIARDNSLTPGSAIFETTRGELDASLTTQLAEIERGLTDILRRRT